MNIKMTDYHGHPVSMSADSLLKLRPTLANLGDPKGCTLVDSGKSGHFVLGNIQEIAGLFSPYIRLAGLHAPDGMQIFLNADAIEEVSVDADYTGNSVAVVGTKWENARVPSRNKIPLLETVDVARTALDAAAKDIAAPVA